MDSQECPERDWVMVIISGLLLLFFVMFLVYGATQIASGNVVIGLICLAYVGLVWLFSGLPPRIQALEAARQWLRKWSE